MFNYFHYRGVCSLDLGVLVSDAEPWTTKETPETVTIPGRGDALLGYEYSNSDAVYNIIIRKTGRDTLTDAVERVRRWLLPDVDYWQFWKVVDGVSYWVLTGKGSPW